MVNQGAETLDAFEHFNRHNYIPPKSSIKEFIYNPKTKSILGRTSSSWGKCNILQIIRNFIYKSEMNLIFQSKMPVLNIAQITSI